MSGPGIELPWGASAMPTPGDPRLVRRMAKLSAEHGALVALTTYRTDPLVVVGHSVVAHLASGAQADAQLRREAATRRWADESGVCVPACDLVEPEDDGGCTLISERVASDPGRRPEYAWAAARAIQPLQEAQAAPPPGGRSWRAPRRTRLLRAARATMSPLRMQEARHLRDAVAALPADGWAHGDYRTYNVLYDSAAHAVRVVDWEYAGRAWRGTDLLALWAGVDRQEVADAILESVLASRRPEEAPDVGLVLLWSCVRVLAEQVTGAPMRQRDHERIRRVDARVSRARRLATDLGAVWR